MDEVYNELKGKLSIHIHALHEDAEGQPDLCMQAGELAAELKATAKRAKLAVEEAKAEVNRDARTNPESYGIEKVTEAAIGAAILINHEVQFASRAAIDAELEADKASTLAHAFDHRKSMIVEEVKMYLNNYFGEVAVGEMGEAKDGLRDDKEARILKRREAAKKKRREVDVG